jgi:hypothetical protein
MPNRAIEQRALGMIRVTLAVAVVTIEPGPVVG